MLLASTSASVTGGLNEAHGLLLQPVRQVAQNAQLATPVRAEQSQRVVAKTMVYIHRSQRRVSIRSFISQRIHRINS
jgi:hypothetical protein